MRFRLQVDNVFFKYARHCCTGHVEKENMVHVPFFFSNIVNYFFDCLSTQGMAYVQIEKIKSTNTLSVSVLEIHYMNVLRALFTHVDLSMMC